MQVVVESQFHVRQRSDSVLKADLKSKDAESFSDK